jgi:hypothetical protein
MIPFQRRLYPSKTDAGMMMMMIPKRSVTWHLHLGKWTVAYTCEIFVIWEEIKHSEAQRYSLLLTGYFSDTGCDLYSRGTLFETRPTILTVSLHCVLKTIVTYYLDTSEPCFFPVPFMSVTNPGFYCGECCSIVLYFIVLYCVLNKLVKFTLQGFRLHHWPHTNISTYC